MVQAGWGERARRWDTVLNIRFSQKRPAARAVYQPDRDRSLLTVSCSGLTARRLLCQQRTVWVGQVRRRERSHTGRARARNGSPSALLTHPYRANPPDPALPVSHIRSNPSQHVFRRRLCRLYLLQPRSLATACRLQRADSKLSADTTCTESSMPLARLVQNLPEQSQCPVHNGEYR